MNMKPMRTSRKNQFSRSHSMCVHSFEILRLTPPAPGSIPVLPRFASHQVRADEHDARYAHDGDAVQIPDHPFHEVMSRHGEKATYTRYARPGRGSPGTHSSLGGLVASRRLQRNTTPMAMSTTATA